MMRLSTKSAICFAAGAVAGALVMAGTSYWPFTIQALQENAPAGLQKLSSTGIRFKSLASPVPGFDTWEISTPEHPEATTVLAITSPDSQGYVIGELFDGHGVPQSQQLLGEASRASLSFAEIAIRSQWLPGTEGMDTAEPVYLMAQPTSSETHSLWIEALEHAALLPSIRVIPTPFTSASGFESVLDIFVATHESGADLQTAAQHRMLDYMSGNREVPLALKQQTYPHPTAVSSLSMNSNLHHQLRVGDSPVVLTHDTKGGIEVKNFDQWLKTQLGR